MEQIIAKNFPNLGKEIGIQVQKVQRTLSKSIKNRSTTRYIIVKLANLRNKEKILKAAWDKRSITYKGRNITLAADLSTETWQARKDWHDIFKVLKGEDMQPRILYAARLSFRIEREIKSFQDKQKLKEFVVTKPALQEILKGTL